MVEATAEGRYGWDTAKLFVVLLFLEAMGAKVFFTPRFKKTAGGTLELLQALKKSGRYYSDHSAYEVDRGTKEAVDAAVKATISHYPPQGYGTREEARITLPSGEVVAVVYRSRSCD